jgi:hypothetical protein
MAALNVTGAGLCYFYFKGFQWRLVAVAFLRRTSLSLVLLGRLSDFALLYR